MHENAAYRETAVLAEYSALKHEQAQRIVLRDTCLYISISANTAIAAIYFQQQNSDGIILLFTPFASTLLFWVYATNDSMITQIREYILNHIVPKPRGNLFGWEYIRRRRTITRVVSKFIRLVAVWCTFSIASIAALAVTAHKVSGITHDPLWIAAAAFAVLPYVFGLWLIDL